MLRAISCLLFCSTLCSAQVTETDFDSLAAGATTTLEQSTRWFTGAGPLTTQIDVEFSRGQFDFDGLPVGSMVGQMEVYELTIDTSYPPGNPLFQRELEFSCRVDYVSVSSGVHRLTAVIEEFNVELDAPQPDVVGEALFHIDIENLPGMGATLRLDPTEIYLGAIGAFGAVTGLPIVRPELHLENFVQSPLGGALVLTAIDQPSSVEEPSEELFFLEGPQFVRGDVNGSLTVDIADPILVLQYLFEMETNLCVDAADFEDNGSVDISDVVQSLAYLMAGGDPPTVPQACGDDLTDDFLDCAVTACAP